MRLIGLAVSLTLAPLAAEGQAGKVYRIGFLGLSSAAEYAENLQAFRQGLLIELDAERREVRVRILISRIEGRLSMATYEAIRRYVRRHFDFYVSDCSIAHVKELCGLKPRRAPNRIGRGRQNPCLREHLAAIKNAFRHFGIISVAFTVAVIAALAVVTASDAEVIELKTGQRVEGTVKSVNSTEVLLDVAGQSVTFPREKVAAIYFGAPPRSLVGSPLNDALKVLKGLQSATGAGVNYRDYAPRVTDAKIQVDQLLGDTPDGPAKTALAEALGFYVYASNAWNAGIAKSNYEAVALNPLYDKCEPLKREVERLDRGRSAGVSPNTIRGISISIVGVSPILNCANERVIEAERLVRGQ